MNETTYAYIVHSDINENNIYSEFEKEEDAIAYARKHKDELTYVDKAEVALDEDGEIIEIFDSETIWVYDDEDDLVLTEETVLNFNQEEETEFYRLCREIGIVDWADIDAFKQETGCDNSNLLQALRDYRNELGLDFDIKKADNRPLNFNIDDLVEELEEHEDMVECKECFDLVAKESCHKNKAGKYVCEKCSKSLGEEIKGDVKLYNCVFDGDYIGDVYAENEMEAYAEMEETWPEYCYNFCDGIATVELADEEDLEEENQDQSTNLEENKSQINMLEIVKETVDKNGYDYWVYGGSGYVAHCIEIVKEGDNYVANEYVSTESGNGDTDPEYITESEDFREVIKFLVDEGWFNPEEDSHQEITAEQAHEYLARTEKPLTEDLSEDKLQVMEDYLKSTKFASLDTEWEDTGDFYVDIIGAYLDYNTRTNMFTLGLSTYHASEDNNANYPERYTDEEEFSYDSLAEMYEDEECKEFLDRIYADNLAKLTKPLTETKCKDCGGELKDNKCTACNRDWNLEKCKRCGGEVKDGKCTHCDHDFTVDHCKACGGEVKNGKCTSCNELVENAIANNGFRTKGYRTALASYDTDDYDINVELGFADEDDYEVVDEEYLLCPGQTVADLVVYLSRECGFTNIYVRGERVAFRDDIKTVKKFKTVPGNHDYNDYGTIEYRIVESTSDTLIEAAGSKDKIKSEFDEAGYVTEGTYTFDKIYDAYIKAKKSEPASLKDFIEYIRETVISVNELYSTLGLPAPETYKVKRKAVAKMRVDGSTFTEAIPMTRDELMDKEGTDDIELINAGRPEEERVELVEDANSIIDDFRQGFEDPKIRAKSYPNGIFVFLDFVNEKEKYLRLNEVNGQYEAYWFETKTTWQDVKSEEKIIGKFNSFEEMIKYLADNKWFTDDSEITLDDAVTFLNK